MEAWIERLWYGPRGAAFALLWPLLAPASLFTLGRSRSRRHQPGAPAALPVIAIGNLAVGGTGKTQVVLWLAQQAALRGAKVAVISRGYGGRIRGPLVVAPGARAADVGDEPLLLARRLPLATVIVSRDRAAGAALAAAQRCELVLLDDGLQQTSLVASQWVAVFGAEAPLGNGALLPLGPLRDPLSALRAETVVWAHGHGAAAGLPRVDVRSRTRPLGLVPAADLAAALRPLTATRLFAFAGIARPERFFHTLRAAGAALVGSARYRDHRVFSPGDLAALWQRARAVGAESLVCTEKDAVRLPATDLPILALATDLEVLDGPAAHALLRCSSALKP